MDKLTYRVPQGVETARSEYFVMDMNRPFDIPAMRKVYLKEYVYTGQMTEEELETYLGYLDIAGSSATFKAYSALIRSPILKING